MNLIQRFRSIRPGTQVIIWGVICTCLAAIALFPLSPAIRLFEGNDSSVFLSIGQGILDGKVPYRDIWDHKPPMIFFINALGLIITPNSVWGVFILQIVFLSVYNFVLGVAFKDRISTIPLLVLITLCDVQVMSTTTGGNLTSFYPIPFQLMCFLLLRNIQQREHIFTTGLFYGALVSLTFLTRPNSIGVFLGFGLVVVINWSLKSVKEWARLIGGIACGVGLVCIPTLAYFYANNSLMDFWDQVYRFNRYYSMNNSWKDYSNVIKFGVDFFQSNGFGYLCLLSLISIIGEGIFRRRITPEQQMVFFAIVFDVIFIAITGRAKVPYLLTIVPSFSYLIILGICCFQGIRRPAWTTWAAVLAFSVMIVVNYSTEYRINQQASTSRKGKVIQYIVEHTSESDKIVVWGNDAWVTYYSKRQPATKYIYTNMMFFQRYSGHGIIQGFYSQVLKEQPKLIIVTTPRGIIPDGFGDNADDTTREIGAKLRAEYSEVFRLGETVIYELTENE